MATLTIADLDNGKRDLQTVSEVANSRAATTTTRLGGQTTTLYEAIRRIRADGEAQLDEQKTAAEEVIRSLGFRVPVGYAQGLDVTDSRFTVTGPDGKVYAPLSAPFTAGAWDPTQWYVLQNDLNDHKLLVFNSYVASSAAAATLPDGQQIIVERDSENFGLKTQYRVEDGQLLFVSVLVDFLTPEHFGATGSDPVKDTAAFISMLSLGAWKYKPDGRKRYKINKNLNFGPMSQWLAPLNLECLLSDTGQHDQLILADGLHVFEAIDVIIPAGVVRRSVISDDFYGGAKPYRKEFRVGQLRISATDWQSGYTGDGAACFKLANQDFIKIGENEIHGFENAANITDSNKFVIGWTEITKFHRGLQATNIQTMNWEGGVFRGDTEFPSGDAGNNAFVCRGVVNGGFGDFFIYDAGEHGIRVTAQADGVGGYYGGRVSFGNISVYRPGKCGVKVHTGTDSVERVIDVEINSVYVEDAGWELYAPGKTPATGANHFGLNIQTSDNVRIGTYVTRKNAGQFNGNNILLIRDAKTVNIGLIDGSGSYEAGIFGGPSPSSSDWQIQGKLVDCGNGSGIHAAIVIASANLLSRAKFEIDVFNCPSIYNLPSFSGPTNGPIIFDGYYDGITGNLYQGVVGRDKIRANMLPFSWPLSGGTEYPLNTTLLAISDSASVVSVGRTLEVYVSSVSATRFVAVTPSGTPVEAVGLKLAGSWVSAGRDVATNAVLVRRVY